MRGPQHQVGHTPTDLVVHVPQCEIVFTGDLLFEKSYPVAFDSDMLSYAPLRRPSQGITA